VFFGTESAGVSGWNGGDVIFSLGTGSGAGRNGRVGFGTTTPNYFADFVSTGAIGAPYGTTSQRPTIVASTAPIRFNSDSTAYEGGYGVGDWRLFADRSWVRTNFAPISSAYTGWTLAADTGTPQSIASGNTANILGGYGINTAVSATGNATVEVDTAQLSTQYDNINIEPNPVFLYSIIHNPSSSRDWAEQIEIFDNILYYVPFGIDSLYIYDISSNTTYRKLSGLKLNTLTANQSYIRYYDSKIYIYNQSGTNGEAIVDVSNPYSPSVVGTYTNKLGYGFDIKSNYLYAYLDTTIVVYALL
jgi:hypothetical protein